MSKPLRFSRQNSSFVVKINSHFSAQVDVKPNSRDLKTADLQKGLKIVHDGIEIVEGGMGFGAPVAKYSNSMYFPKCAKLILTKDMITVKKVFHMDSIEQAKVGKHLVSRGSGGLAYLYRSSKFFRKPIIKFSELTKKVVNVRSEFKTVASRGPVTIAYKVYADRIRVSCDMTKLDKSGCKGIFILNEQGSSFFRRYEDSDGRHLVDDEIGAWEKVRAKRAQLSDFDSFFSFCLQKVDNANIWLGRETHENIAWAGLIYEIPPNLNSFAYDILIECEVS